MANIAQACSPTTVQHTLQGLGLHRGSRRDCLLHAQHFPDICNTMDGAAAAVYADTRRFVWPLATRLYCINNTKTRVNCLHFLYSIQIYPITCIQSSQKPCQSIIFPQVINSPTTITVYLNSQITCSKPKWCVIVRFLIDIKSLRKMKDNLSLCFATCTPVVCRRNRTKQNYKRHSVNRLQNL